MTATDGDVRVTPLPDQSGRDLLAELHEEECAHGGTMMRLDRYREALERIGVCCDNAAEPENKIAFIRRITRDALDEERA